MFRLFRFSFLLFFISLFSVSCVLLDQYSYQLININLDDNEIVAIEEVDSNKVQKLKSMLNEAVGKKSFFDRPEIADHLVGCKVPIDIEQMQFALARSYSFPPLDFNEGFTPHIRNIVFDNSENKKSLEGNNLLEWSRYADNTWIQHLWAVPIEGKCIDGSIVGDVKLWFGIEPDRDVLEQKHFKFIRHPENALIKGLLELKLTESGEFIEQFIITNYYIWSAHLLSDQETSIFNVGVWSNSKYPWKYSSNYQQIIIEDSKQYIHTDKVYEYQNIHNVIARWSKYPRWSYSYIYASDNSQKAKSLIHSYTDYKLNKTLYFSDENEPIKYSLNHYMDDETVFNTDIVKKDDGNWENVNIKDEEKTLTYQAALKKHREEQAIIQAELLKKQQKAQAQAQARAQAQAQQSQKNSGGGFQWGKLAALTAGALIGGADSLSSSEQLGLVAGMVMDSMEGQEDASNTLSAVGAPSNSVSSSLSTLSSAGNSSSPTNQTSTAIHNPGDTGDAEKNRKIAMDCKSKSENLKPWGNEQTDTLCQLATFDQCLIDNGFPSFKPEKDQACKSLKSTLDALGASMAGCNACLND